MANGTMAACGEHVDHNVEYKSHHLLPGFDDANCDAFANGKVRLRCIHQMVAVSIRSTKTLHERHKARSARKDDSEKTAMSHARVCHIDTAFWEAGDDRQQRPSLTASSQRLLK
ncbi:thiamine-phosphate pyrophosphorylase [Anopheles sinensis]|uniref:Thiamine-phosphate pyrophosphorylase n=1 Tax=Anopheles sinensis TaxID=74873 RepID=A0A084WP43_ANOSI|nr:thiamine-phosphate pyrophosphorylase [Anopheles sinensis]